MTFPVLEGGFCDRGGKFGSHNDDEMRLGTESDPDWVYMTYFNMTYFNAGIRVFDVADPTAPREIAHYIPRCSPGQPAIQRSDLIVGEDGLIHVTDRVAGGLYILERSDR